MNKTPRIEWMRTYRQYRRAGHAPHYAAFIATSVAVHGTPF